MKSWFGVWLAFIAPFAFLTYSHAAEPVSVFSTGFEPEEGYDQNFTLSGQAGWVSDLPSNCQGNGLLDEPPNQWAFIGFATACDDETGLNVWRPLDFSPLGAAKPLVKFRVTIAIIDSQNGFYDCFRWSVYSTNRQRLFTLDFDNLDLSVNYLLENSTTFISTGRRFPNDETMELEVEMDFTANRWHASLSGLSLVTNQPITQANVPLHLGSIDAVWVHGVPSAPGDNYMLFDNYSVTAQAPPVKPLLLPLGFVTAQFLLRVEGENDGNYAVETSTNLSQWTAIGTNRATGGSFLFLDSGASSHPHRFYRARLVP